MLRQALLGVSHSRAVKKVVTKAPVTRSVVARFVPGETVEDALAATQKLVAAGLRVSIDHLGEDTQDRARADQVVGEYLDLLTRLASAGVADASEVSVKLSALGQLLGADGEKIARDNAAVICRAARAAGSQVTLDMEDHTTTDSTLGILADLRSDFPDTGAVLQAYLRRTEGDCRDLAYAGSRVRLCKGAYAEPESVAFAEADEVTGSYRRCLEILMAGPGYPMVATHDPKLVRLGERLAADRAPDSCEFQMLYGIRPNEQRRLAATGHRVRVYLPYGTDWYGYLVRRLAERPANLTFFARSVVSKG